MSTKRQKFHKVALNNSEIPSIVLTNKPFVTKTPKILAVLYRRTCLYSEGLVRLRIFCKKMAPIAHNM